MLAGGMGGTSGGFYCVGLTAAAAALAASSSAGDGAAPTLPSCWAGALRAGTDAMARYGPGPGARTMMDALVPAAEAATAAAAAGGSGVAVAAAAATAATGGADTTRGMAALAGRASYVPASALGDSPDPGAVAAARWLTAIAGVVGAGGAHSA